MAKQAQIQAQAAAEREALEMAAFREVWARRRESDAAYSAYEEVIRQSWAESGSVRYIDFWLQYNRIKDGWRTDLDTLIQYLEADPWEDRSGYAKADCIAYLRRQELSEDQKERLRGIVLQAVNKPNRREFRYYCRLARKVDIPALREALELLTQCVDADIRRRARWVLQSLKDAEAGR